ncbi:MAG TPA: ABC transporter permease [Gaiellaceae bacterium]|nr:ABC transporter permease [Gaiellaceae bacterium]
MGRFALRRAAFGIVVMFLVTVVVFVTTRMIGDPANTLLPLTATHEQRVAFTHQLGLDRPILTQFVHYLGNVSHLDFGNSLLQSRPALNIVLDRLPNTFELVGFGLAIAILFAIPLGVLAALKPGSLVDKATVVVSLSGLSVAQVWLGLLLILVFAAELKVLPSAGIGGIDHLILPGLTLAFPALGRLVMLTRSTMIDELNTQYVQTARAKGIPEIRVVGLHALRNAAIPILTLSGWELIRALAGFSVVVETVFAWPGVGYLAFQSIQQNDVILLQAIVTVMGFLIVAINVGLDVVFKVIDRRVELA